MNKRTLSALEGSIRKWQAMNNGAARQVEQSPGEVAPITGTAGSIPAAAPPSVALPRIVREGRDFDVKFHDNAAAATKGVKV